MLNDPIFKTALVVSLSLHMFFFSAGGFLAPAPHEQKTPQVEVTYMLPEDPLRKMSEKIIERIPDRYDLPKKETKPPENKARETAKTTAPDDNALTATEKKYIREKALAELQEYIAYYELLREKIKARVKDNYEGYADQGTVDAVFTLAQNGILKKLNIDDIRSSKNVRLRKIALASVREAAPFPPFPQALKRSELSFSLAIIFKKD
ncbi:MAG: hypothetical protein ABIH74_05365 [Candidatus Omnitrophota bacterium]